MILCSKHTSELMPYQCLTWRNTDLLVRAHCVYVRPLFCYNITQLFGLLTLNAISKPLKESRGDSLNVFLATTSTVIVSDCHECSAVTWPHCPLWSLINWVNCRSLLRFSRNLDVKRMWPNTYQHRTVFLVTSQLPNWLVHTVESRPCKLPRYTHNFLPARRYARAVFAVERCHCQSYESATGAGVKKLDWWGYQMVKKF